MRSKSQTRTHLLTFAVVLLLAFPLAFYPIFADPPELRGGSDFAINWALQNSYRDTSRYARDSDLQAMRSGYLPLYTSILSTVVGTFSSVTATYLTLSIILWLIFLAGMYYWTWSITQQRMTAAIATLACGFGYRAFNGTLWGIQLGQVLPRDFFVALTPWVIIALLATRSKPPYRYGMFLALGLLADIHFLEAWYLIGFALLFLAGMEITRKQRTRDAVRIGTYAIPALIGSIPAFLQNFSAASPQLIPALLHYRMPYLFSLGVSSAAWWLLIPATLAVFGWHHLASKSRKVLTTAVLAAVLLSVAGHFLAQLFPQLLLLQFARASKLIYLGLLPLAAMGSITLLRQSSLQKGIGAISIGLLVVPLPLGIGTLPTFTTPTAEQLRDQQLTGNPTDSPEAFLDIARWAKVNTPTDALFLAPPNGFALWFRPIAERSVVVTQKDGSNMILTQSDGGQAWYDRYTTVREAYLNGTITDTAGQYNASFIIVDNAQELDLPMRYENDAFRVYETSR